MDRSVFESCEEDADELFNHLEELLRGKDAMGKKGRRLAQARAAREALERQRSVLGQQKELEAIDADLAAIAIERSEALAREDEEQEKSCRLRLLQLENARAIRAGAKNDAQRKLDAALAQYGFENIEKACDGDLPEDEFVALEAEVEEYKRDFAMTLEKCQRIEEGQETVI